MGYIDILASLWTNRQYSKSRVELIHGHTYTVIALTCCVSKTWMSHLTRAEPLRETTQFLLTLYVWSVCPTTGWRWHLLIALSGCLFSVAALFWYCPDTHDQDMPKFTFTYWCLLVQQLLLLPEFMSDVRQICTFFNCPSVSVCVHSFLYPLVWLWLRNHGIHAWSNVSKLNQTSWLLHSVVSLVPDSGARSLIYVCFSLSMQICVCAPLYP